ncbi:DUF2267 domain-containing protein [Halorussus sp. AFM4]|uniref:DUF2267 domain-containing protein n=1 Tax=Halorussus sp. AFM4 TaxID=3421651 RepID=UPI003EBF7E20
MKRDQFLTEVQERAEFDDDQTANDAAEAVLRTLGERLQAGEADDLAAQLPDGIDEYVATDEAEQFDFEEFTDRVEERLDTGVSPKHASQAVASVVVDAASTGELQDVVSEFPRNEGYGELLALADESAS